MKVFVPLYVFLWNCPPVDRQWLPFTVTAPHWRPDLEANEERERMALAREERAQMDLDAEEAACTSGNGG